MTMDDAPRAYLGALVAGDRDAALAVVDRLMARGVPRTDVYVDVLAPAMHAVGRAWEQGRMTVAEEHLATQITQAALERFGGEHASGRGRRALIAVVACSPGELHALGARMVADEIAAHRWSVLHLGADTPIDALVRLAEERQADLVALSASTPDRLASAASVRALLIRTARPPFVLVGGRGVALAPAALADVVCDAALTDLRELPRVLAHVAGSR